MECINGCPRKIKCRGFCQSCYYKGLRNGTIIPGSKGTIRKHFLTSVNAKTMTGTCLEDGLVKITPRNKDHTGWQCTLRANAGKRQWKRRQYRPKEAMLKEACEICGGQGSKLCWDHNHETGKFRGTLCNECNLVLGLFHDNRERVRKAYIYLGRE